MTPLLAGLSMFVKDSLEALIAQAETRGHGVMAGGLDVIKWLAEITTVTIAVTNIFEHGWVAAIPIIICVEIGNFTGRLAGTRLGDRFIHEN